MTMFETTTWRKSTRSQNGSACVEVARQVDVIGMRDSKDPASAVLTFTPAQWHAFLITTKTGRFDPR